MSASTSDPGSWILVLCIMYETEEIFKRTHIHLLAALEQKFDDVRFVNNSDSACDMLNHSPGSRLLPKAILVADEGITHVRRNRRLLHSVLRYAMKGGTCILMDRFVRWFARTKDWSFFKDIGLPWRSGQDRPMRVRLVPRIPRRQTLYEVLPLAYSMNGMPITKVRQGTKVYQHWSEDLQSLWDPGEVTVAMAHYWQGWLCYLGDLGSEEESSTAVLAMCGVWGSIFS